MGTKLYVGNLPFSTTGEDLKTAFSAHGTVVEASVITDKFSGRSRGFGFVEMDSDDGAKKAIESLNETELGGLKIIVNEARPANRDSSRPPRERGFDGGGRRSY